MPQPLKKKQKPRCKDLSASYRSKEHDKSLKIEQDLSKIDRILRIVYKTPDLGNTVDPLEELIYLSIAQRTRIELAREVFQELKQTFYPWKRILDPASHAKLRVILSKGGRGNIRFRAITELMGAIKQRTGKLSLEFLRSYSLDQARNFLLSLPWVGEKTAYCVLLYSLGHSVFPADSNVIRVFRRTAILEPLVGSLDNIDHRKAQKKIALHITQDIAYTLHVNMVAHGKKICTEKNPKCPECPIRLFCNYYRESTRQEVEKLDYTAVDMFCGAGGISHGLLEAGIRPVLGVDSHPPSCETYRFNIPVQKNAVVNADIRDLTEKEILSKTHRKRVHVLAAGVPCKGFSRVGLKTKPNLLKERPVETEEVNGLFRVVLKWAKVLKPEFILLENVPEMAKSKVRFGLFKGLVTEVLQRELNKIGYHTSTVSVNAADFGLPQQRKRIFFIARRKKPLPDHIEDRLLKIYESLEHEDVNTSVCLSRALKGLKSLRPGNGEEISEVSPYYPHSEQLQSFYEESIYDMPVAFNHVARTHNQDDRVIISSLLQGEDYRSLIERKPEVIKNRKRKVYKADNFPDKFYRLPPDKPCRTIVSHLSQDGNSFIHPSQNRSLTVREAARIQSFPDSFVFFGPRTQQFIQVGNAVPPLLAYIVGLFFKHLLEGSKRHARNK